MLKTLAILVNIGWLGFVLLRILPEFRFGSHDWLDGMGFAFLLVMPIVNLICILRPVESRSTQRGFFSLFFERKRLEELRRVEALRKGADPGI